MPDAVSGPGITDSAGLGLAVGRLAGSSRKAGRSAFMVLACNLEDGETVQAVVQCRFRGAAGAMALTDRRLLIVNAREWNPDVIPVGLEPGLTVQGWQDGGSAAIVLGRDGHEIVIDRISDLDLVQEIVGEIRSRSGD